MLYRLFGIPRTVQEYIDKVSKQHYRIVISYKTEESVVRPQGNFSAFLSYKIFLILDSFSIADGREDPKKDRVYSKERKGEVKNTLKLELEAGTKTQFADVNPLLRETLNAVQGKLPEIVELCNKKHVAYSLDEKTNDLLLNSR